MHISEFPPDGQRPQLHELISFEIQKDAEGKSRALWVMRPGQGAGTRRAARTQPPERSRWSLPAALLLVALGAAGLYGYTRITAPSTELAEEEDEEEAPATAAVPRATPEPSRCDGRTMCSQMTSCAEATYFIKHCPGTKMDGDGDGVPCETQWCG